MRSDVEKMLQESPEESIRAAQETFDRIIGRPKRPVVLAGAGEVGRNALQALRRENVEVVCFVDNDPLKWGTTIAGLPALSPAAAAERFGATCAFVVSWKCDDATFEAERKRLLAFGAKEVLPFSVLLQKWPEIAGWPSETPAYYASHASDVLRVHDLLHDEESKRQYEGHLRWRILRDFAALPHGELHDQYFRAELVRLIPDECFVDGGAFDGDSIRTFLRDRCEHFRQIHAFEPDPRSYDALVKFTAALSPELGSKVKTWPFALSDRRGEARFSALGNHSSSIGGGDSGGTITVQTAALDELLPANSRVTFVKLDLEGAETPALKGAEKTIVRDRPIVTVAVYHRPTDLLRLPLWLSEMCPRYRFHLRTHNRYGLDVVLYAIPIERAIA